MTILQDKQLVTNYLYRNFKQTVIKTALLFLPYVLGVDLIEKPVLSIHSKYYLNGLVVCKML